MNLLAMNQKNFCRNFQVFVLALVGAGRSLQVEHNDVYYFILSFKDEVHKVDQGLDNIMILISGLRKLLHETRRDIKIFFNLLHNLSSN